MNKIRIAILDDQTLLRKGLNLLLENIQDFNVVMETSCKDQIAELFRTNPPDILIMDFLTKEERELKFIKELKGLSPSKIIILSIHDRVEYIVQAFKSGISSYLLKNIEPEELEKAIRAIYTKGKYFNPFLSKILVESILKPKVIIEKISTREKEILTFIAKGFTTKLIAVRLGISTRTVEAHRTKLMKKTNSTNSSELIKKAMESNIIN